MVLDSAIMAILAILWQQQIYLTSARLSSIVGRATLLARLRYPTLRLDFVMDRLQRTPWLYQILGIDSGYSLGGRGGKVKCDCVLLVCLYLNLAEYL